MYTRERLFSNDLHTYSNTKGTADQPTGKGKPPSRGGPFP